MNVSLDAISKTARRATQRLGLVHTHRAAGVAGLALEAVSGASHRAARERRYTILLREDPLKLGDWMSQSISTAGAVGGKVAGSAVTSSLVSSGTIASGGLAAGALTAGIGAGVAILVSVLAGIWRRTRRERPGRRAKTRRSTRRLRPSTVPCGRSSRRRMRARSPEHRRRSMPSRPFSISGSIRLPICRARGGRIRLGAERTAGTARSTPADPVSALLVGTSATRVARQAAAWAVRICTPRFCRRSRPSILQPGARLRPAPSMVRSTGRRSARVTR